MTDSAKSTTEAEDTIQLVAKEIQIEAANLKAEAQTMRVKHQFFTVATILLGVAAPAFVTYSPTQGSGVEVWWKVVAIIVTALASASATIRTVLRYGDRYANSSLTSMALEDLYAELHTKRNEVLLQVRPDSYRLSWQNIHRGAASRCTALRSPMWRKRLQPLRRTR